MTSASSTMDYMRIPPEQMLLDRYLSNDSDTIERDMDMATLKSRAQEALDRAGIHVSDPSKHNSESRCLDLIFL